MKMPGGKGLADRMAPNGVDTLAPEASVSVSLGGEVQRVAVRRPVCPILRPYICDPDPGAFGNRLRPAAQLAGLALAHQLLDV